MNIDCLQCISAAKSREMLEKANYVVVDRECRACERREKNRARFKACLNKEIITCPYEAAHDILFKYGYDPRNCFTYKYKKLSYELTASLLHTIGFDHFDLLKEEIREKAINFMINNYCVKFISEPLKDFKISRNNTISLPCVHRIYLDAWDRVGFSYTKNISGNVVIFSASFYINNQWVHVG